MNLIKRLFNVRQAAPDRNFGFASFGGHTQAGISVNEEIAINYAAVWACVKIISESVSALPWHVVEANGEFRNRLNSHALTKILSKAANHEVDAMTWRESALRDALLWGNHYSEIERNGRGDVIGLWRLDPSKVALKRDGDGKLYYELRDGGNATPVSFFDVLHVKGPSNDGLTGLSTIRHARESIGLGMAVEKFGSAFFGNGAQLSGVITNKAGGLSKEAVQNLLSSFNRMHGGVYNAHKVGYLDADMDFKTIGVPPDDAQFLQSRKFNILDICRWFRVPPHKLAELERSTHSNIEQQSIEFVTDALLPWIRRLESAVEFKLLRDENGITTKINTNGELRGDSAARAAYYSQLFNIGVLSPNQIAALEDLPPVPGGDAHYIPLNLAPTNKALTAGQILSVHEVADAYTRNAANALKKVKTADQLTKFFEERNAQFESMFRPLCRLLFDDDKTPKIACEWAKALETFSEKQAASTFDDAAEALRSFAPKKIIEIFKGQKNDNI